MSHAAKPRYRLTPAGMKALKAERSVPSWYWSILCLVECEIAVGAMLKLMPAESPKQVLAWMDELETLGFIELEPHPVAIHRMAA